MLPRLYYAGHVRARQQYINVRNIQDHFAEQKLVSRFHLKNAKIKIKADFHFKQYCEHEIS